MGLVNDFNVIVSPEHEKRLSVFTVAPIVARSIMDGSHTAMNYDRQLFYNYMNACGFLMDSKESRLSLKTLAQIVIDLEGDVPCGK